MSHLLSEFPGFHQFYNKINFVDIYNEDSDINDFLSEKISESQSIISIILFYLFEMGIDPAILALSSAVAPDELIFPDTDTLKSLNVLTDEEMSGWDMSVFRGGILTKSVNKRKDSMLYEVTFACDSSSNMKILIMRTETTRSNHGYYGLNAIVLDIDSGTFKASFDDLYLDTDGEITYISFALGQEFIDALYRSNFISFSMDAARVVGGFRERANLSNEDKEKIRLAFKNCVDL